MTPSARHIAALVPVLVATGLLAAGCSGTTATSSTSPSAASTSTVSSSVSAPPVDSASTCDAAATLVEMTEGPYYTPGAPERSTISDADTIGIPLVVSGTVYDAGCQPVSGATLDFWQADGAGTYDNQGYALRGVQTTDADGAYALTTVIPGIYPSRTEHIHVKVTAPGGQTYTTQLYFPDVPQNDSDGIFDPAMLVTVDRQDASSMVASFDFVLP